MEGEKENHVERMQRESNFTAKAIAEAVTIASNFNNLLHISIPTITRAQNAIRAVPENLRGPAFDREAVITEISRAFGDSLGIEPGMTVKYRDDLVGDFTDALRVRLRNQ